MDEKRVTKKGLRPFFSFYGGKWRAAPKYPLPRYETIVEPFAGAAGYAMRYPERRVILVEKDPVIAALWLWLTRVSPAEVRRIPLLGPLDCVDDLRDVTEEARTLVGFWLNAGVPSPRKHPSAWMRWCIETNKLSCRYWGEMARERIASQVEQIRHWRVIFGSYEQAPNIAATWFVDPPYQKAGKHYRYPAKDIDFSRLSEWVRERQGQVMVCENEGATWLPFVPFAHVKSNKSNSGSATSAEVIFLQNEGLSP